MTAPADPDAVRVWSTNEEYSARVGCGVIGAWVLPAWFILMFLAIGPDQSEFAVWMTLVLVAIVLVISAAALLRVRRICRRVSERADGSLVFHARPSRTVPSGGIEHARIGKGPGLDPVRIATNAGMVRMPRDFDDFDDLLNRMVEHSPDAQITDERYV